MIQIILFCLSLGHAETFDEAATKKFRQLLVICPESLKQLDANLKEIEDLPKNFNLTSDPSTIDKYFQTNNIPGQILTLLDPMVFPADFTLRNSLTPCYSHYREFRDDFFDREKAESYLEIWIACTESTYQELREVPKQIRACYTRIKPEAAAAHPKKNRKTANANE